MPDFDNRKDAWEYNAREQLDEFQQKSEDDLLDIIKKWERDMYFVIWDALKKKWTREKSWPVLVRVLDQLNDKELYLERYHICETFFYIFKIKNEERFWNLTGNRESFDLTKKKATLDDIKKRYSIATFGWWLA